MNDPNRYLKHEVTRLTEENRTLKEEVVSLRQYLDALNSLARAVEEMNPSQEVMALLDRLLYNAVGVINAEAGSLLVVDDETQDLVFVISHGSVPHEKLAGIRIPAGKGIAGWVAAHNKPTIVNNTAGDARFFSGVDTRVSYTTNSVLAVPIAGRSGVLGVVEVLNKRSSLPFTQTDQTLLSLLCKFAGEVLSEIMASDSAEETARS